MGAHTARTAGRAWTWRLFPNGNNHAGEGRPSRMDKVTPKCPYCAGRRWNPTEPTRDDGAKCAACSGIRATCAGLNRRGVTRRMEPVPPR